MIAWVSFRQRGKIIHKLGDLILENLEEFAIKTVITDLS